MSTKYVLVDYQNHKLKPADFECLLNDNYHVVIFICEGNDQPKIPEKVEANPNTKVMRLRDRGKNAVDFYIAFYIGRTHTQNPQARFEIVSRDKGYLALIKNLNQEGIAVQPRRKFSSGAAKAMINSTGQPKSRPAQLSFDKAYELAKENLKKTLKNLPGRKIRLGNAINSWGVYNKFPDIQPESILQRLQDDGFVEVQNEQLDWKIEKLQTATC